MGKRKEKDGADYAEIAQTIAEFTAWLGERGYRSDLIQEKHLHELIFEFLNEQRPENEHSGDAT